MKLIGKVISEEHVRMIKNFAKRSGQVLVPILGVALSSISVKDILDMTRYSGEVGYGDAVNAIMTSNMYSSDKNKAVSILKRDETSDFYKAVINVARGNAYSSDKVRTISNMSVIEAETE